MSGRPTDEDKRLLKEALDMEKQRRYLKEEVSSLRRRLGVLEAMDKTLGRLQAIMQKEIKERKLEAAWRGTLHSAGMKGA